jgi:hypothetical protein
MERKWPEAEMQYLKEVGFNVKPGNNATAHALSVDAQTGQFRAAAR